MHIFRSTFFYSLIFILLLTGIFSCEEPQTPDPNENPDPVDSIGDFLSLDLDNLHNYAAQPFPAHYTSPQVQDNDNSPLDNPVTDMGATLGRVLFYDPQLSTNNTVSCASCHEQKRGFTDGDRFSEGFEGGLTGAHSMRLGNTNYFGRARMFWDKRAEDLETQSTQPIQDAIEMGFTETIGGIDSLVSKLSARPYYPILFERAFGSELITEERIQNALAQFIRSMVSVNSKFDEGYAAVYSPGPQNSMLRSDFPNFTDQENEGKRLFLGDGPGQGRMGGASCNTCHQAPTFSLGNNSLSNGLDAGETVAFKSPSLKNIALSSNFMHDGRFTTLREVIDHYADGIQVGPALDQRLTLPGNQPLRVDFTEAEREALVAFLQTLTDPVLTEDEKFSDPFK